MCVLYNWNELNTVILFDTGDINWFLEHLLYFPSDIRAVSNEMNTVLGVTQ